MRFIAKLSDPINTNIQLEVMPPIVPCVVKLVLRLHLNRNIAGLSISLNRFGIALLPCSVRSLPCQELIHVVP